MTREEILAAAKQCVRGGRETDVDLAGYAACGGELED